MPISNIRITGLNKLNKNMMGLQMSLRPTLESATLKAVLYAQSKVPPYPPQPEGSTYVRTHLLGNSITAMAGSHPNALSRVEALGGEIRGVIGTNVEYAQYVIDRDRQAAHMGYWWTLQDAILRARDGIVKIYEQAVDGIARRVK